MYSGQQLNFVVSVGGQNGLFGDAVGFLRWSDWRIILSAGFPKKASVIFAEENSAGFAFSSYLLDVLYLRKEKEAHKFIDRRLVCYRQDFGIQWRQKIWFGARRNAVNGFWDNGSGDLTDEFINADADVTLQADFGLNVAGN